MEKPSFKNLAIALAVCLSLGAAVAAAPVYPCGYWGFDMLYADNGFAGYGHHSLFDVLANGFFWSEDTVPVPNEHFKGDAPFYVVGQWTISLLYIPILLAILYLGYVLATGQISRSAKSLHPKLD